MAVWRHVAGNHVDPFFVPFVCQCGAVFKSLVQISKHMVAKGCTDCEVSIGYDKAIFKRMIAKKECAPSFLEPISDEELDFVETLHTPNYSWRSGLMPVLQDLEDVSDVPLEDYLSDTESSCSSCSSSCSTTPKTVLYASDMDLSLNDSDDDMFDYDQ